MEAGPGLAGFYEGEEGPLRLLAWRGGAGRGRGGVGAAVGGWVGFPSVGGGGHKGGLAPETGERGDSEGAPRKRLAATSARTSVCWTTAMRMSGGTRRKGTAEGAAGGPEQGGSVSRMIARTPMKADTAGRRGALRAALAGAWARRRARGWRKKREKRTSFQEELCVVVVGQEPGGRLRSRGDGACRALGMTFGPSKAALVRVRT